MIVFDRGGTMIMIAGKLDRRLARRIVAEYGTAGEGNQIQQVGCEGDEADDGMASLSAHNVILGAGVYVRCRWIDKSS